jgi:uncharacterized RDD family membrane protein YckC
MSFEATRPFLDLTDRAAFDPALVPERYEAVRRRRILAFVIDLVIVAFLTLLADAVILVLGVFTLGLAWLLLGSMFPAIAILYSGLALGGPAGATIGMRIAGLEMRSLSGGRVPFIVGAAHVVGLYLSISLLTPLVLAVSLFDPRKRLLQDLVLGTVIVNDSRQATGLRRI